jgi:hypothetical protein
VGVTKEGNMGMKIGDLVVFRKGLYDDEDKPGVILDYDDKGNLVSLEILDASQRVNLPSKMEYQVSPVAG